MANVSMINDNYIYDLYTHYCFFMGLIHAPEFTIEYISSENAPSAYYYALTSVNTEPMVLSINTYLISKLSKDRIDAILFHEFTHITDTLYFKSICNDFIDGVMLYTEYHATQIGFMYQYKILKLYNIKPYVDDNVIEGLTKQQAQEENNYIIAAESFNTFPSVNEYYRLRALYMYYLGITSILKNIIHIDVSPIPFIDPCAEEFQKIFKVLTVFKYNVMPSRKAILYLSLQNEIAMQKLQKANIISDNT